MKTFILYTNTQVHYPTIISNLFVSCLAIYQMIENKHGHGQNCEFKYHNTFACSKQYTNMRNLPLILEEPEVTGETNKLPEAIHNPDTRSTSSPKPGSMFTRTTLIVLHVGVIRFG